MKTLLVPTVVAMLAMVGTAPAASVPSEAIKVAAKMHESRTAPGPRGMLFEDMQRSRG